MLFGLRDVLSHFLEPSCPKIATHFPLGAYFFVGSFPDFNCNVLGRSLLNTGVNKSELRPYSASDIFSFIITYIPCLFPGKLPDKSGKHLLCTESLCIRLAFYFNTYNETEDLFCFLNWISCAWTFINPFLKGSENSQYRCFDSQYQCV